VPNPIVYWEISSPQGKELQSFYSSMFDWDIDANNDYGYGLVDTKVEGAVKGGVGLAPDSNLVTIYVQVDDLQAALDKVERMGGKTVMPPMVISDELAMAQFADPAGNVIGLIKT